MIYTDGIIFDLDGTLWDSVRTGFSAWHIKLKEIGIQADFSYEAFKACYGLPMNLFFDRLLPGKIIENQDQIMKNILNYENIYLREHGGILYPQVEETLQELQKKFPLTIVSNCQVGYIEAFLFAHKLEKYFCDILSYGDNGLMKDENIALMAKRNGFLHPVYVGDIQADADSTHKAGLPFIHAAYGFGKVKDAEERIENFSQLLQVLKEVE